MPDLRTRKFKLFYVKGDSYTDLDEAFNISKTTYDQLGKSLPNDTQKNNLRKTIDIWNKALEEVDLNNKKARINKKVAQRIHHNIAMTALALTDHDLAVKHLQEILLIRAGNSFSWGGMAPEEDIGYAQDRKRRFELSPKIASDKKSLLMRIEALKKHSESIALSTTPGPEYETLAVAVREFENRAAGEKIAQKVEALKSAAGENPFRLQVQHTSMQGYVLFLTGFMTKKYDEFPPQIFDLTQLNQLQLSGNNVKNVPDDIGSLINLKVLKLHKNKIEEVAPGIGKLVNLEKLDLSKNNLKSLPNEISKLKKLKKINLKGNNFSKQEIERIKSLLPKKCKVKT